MKTGPLPVLAKFAANFGILERNAEPALHSHLVPRYLSEPDDKRRRVPWTTRINIREADRDMVRLIASIESPDWFSVRVGNSEASETPLDGEETSAAETPAGPPGWRTVMLE